MSTFSKYYILRDLNDYLKINIKIQVSMLERSVEKNILTNDVIRKNVTDQMYKEKINTKK